MAHCKKCGRKRAQRRLRPFMVSTLEQPNDDKYATVYFTRLFNLTVNGVNRMYQPGETTKLSYPIIKFLFNLNPTNPAIQFIYEDELVAFHKSDN